MEEKTSSHVWEWGFEEAGREFYEESEEKHGKEELMESQYSLIPTVDEAYTPPPLPHFFDTKMEGTMQCSANYVPLSPISFLERSAVVYSNRLSIVHGDVKFTWRETCDRCLRLASALTQLGISRGGVVAALAPNIPAIHSEAKIILVDHQLLDIAKGALEILSKASARNLWSSNILRLEPEWNSLSPDEQAKIQARQRVNHIGLEEVDVKYPESMKSVLFDVKTNGRLVSKGDLSVKRLDGYMELNDRSKDIIISGGENISTSEVESVIFSHPTVLEAAVVGRPDDHWGETPCAFV
ncbi:putative acyl-activating enzyme 1, peroxisomal [Capsicum chinense]|nr:putative acyl-activating enzyme 1, peroxisomal [Capsicum chinense]